MPKVLLTKAQERQERASRVLKISIMDQHTDQQQLSWSDLSGDTSVRQYSFKHF